MERFINDSIIFIKELELLKDATRTAWTKEGRRESVAEHSWRLAMFALSLEELFPSLDTSKVLKMCLIHDLGEAYEGDISAILNIDQDKKLASEEDSIYRLTQNLSHKTKNVIIDLWTEYINASTEEAKLVKALDKLETIIQHNQGNNPVDFDYNFNLEYGREHTDSNKLTKEIRAIIDKETIEKINK